MKWINLAIGLVAMTLAACANIGLQTPGAVQEVYDTAQGVDQTVYATIGVYTVVIEEAAVTCTGDAVPFEACDVFAGAVDRVNPGVELAAQAWGEAFFYRDLVREIRADGEIAAPELIAAAATAFGEASSQWARLEPAVQRVIGQGRDLTDTAEPEPD